MRMNHTILYYDNLKIYFKEIGLIRILGIFSESLGFKASNIIFHKNSFNMNFCDLLYFEFMSSQGLAITYLLMTQHES